MTRLPALLCSVLLAAPLAAQTAKPKPTPAPAAAPAAGLDAVKLKALKARSLGPAVMGGRVSDIGLDPADPSTWYVAVGLGGLWKTSNDGVTFQSLLDDQMVVSLGAVAVAPSDPKVVWAGSGEANDRNSSGWGDGVYRSTDGGSTWAHAGLKTSRAIARIVVHPQDPQTAWVAAVGDLWGPGGERGCFKTGDGGKTWKAALKAPAPLDAKVGCGDIAIDPSNPDVVYAALYGRQRTPWSFVSGVLHSDGKDVGGIYKSNDGGATWHRLEKGLPPRTQRIGLSVYRKDPKVVYAVVQSDEGGTATIGEARSKRGGVFRSEDAGETWVRQSPLDPRPFYFSQIRVDPDDDQRIYLAGFMLHVSDDGGKTFREDLTKHVHSDIHAIAIDPRRPARVLMGTDGGVYFSRDRGKAWEHIARIPAGEFYRINVDQGTPYRICGGLQDNVNWVGPSATRSKEGIVNSDWTQIGGGDGFYCVFDPDDPNLIYAESQRGSAHRIDLRSGQIKELRPQPAEGQAEFRFHWNSPLVASPHSKGKLYLAGNHVFELNERGEHWRQISPDLSAQDPQKTTTTGSGAETYGVVYTLAESPARAGLLWAGTDDGKLWVTEDGGGHWTDLTANLPAAAKGQWLSRVEPGHRDPKLAYLVVSAFRSQNHAPLVYRTTDLGRTWTSLAGNLPADVPAKVLREDPKNPDVLYLGTENALLVSVDRGERWLPLGSLPPVPVDDILVHPRDNDLVIATHGRSLYVIDDVRALQELSPADDLRVFEPRPGLAFHPLDGWVDSAGAGHFRGDNPPAGAQLTVWVKDYTGDPIKVRIETASGLPVANLEAPGTPGLNRLSWNLKLTKDLMTEYGGEGRDLFVRPGEYKVKVSRGAAKAETTLKVDVVPGVETR
jgi:photosystem II stability/assembly factor-like uncharacterized protein